MRPQRQSLVKRSACKVGLVVSPIAMQEYHQRQVTASASRWKTDRISDNPVPSVREEGARFHTAYRAVRTTARTSSQSAAGRRGQATDQSESGSAANDNSSSRCHGSYQHLTTRQAPARCRSGMPRFLPVHTTVYYENRYIVIRARGPIPGLSRLSEPLEAIVRM